MMQQITIWGECSVFDRAFKKVKINISVISSCSVTFYRLCRYHDAIDETSSDLWLM